MRYIINTLLTWSGLYGSKFDIQRGMIACMDAARRTLRYLGDAANLLI